MIIQFFKSDLVKFQFWYDYEEMHFINTSSCGPRLDLSIVIPPLYFPHDNIFNWILCAIYESHLTMGVL